MDWLLLLLMLNGTAPPTMTVEPAANQGLFEAAKISVQARGWPQSDRSEASNTIMRLQIARRTRN
jgi:hypothetical protein